MYSPDPDGYFVCKVNMLITNKAYCKTRQNTTDVKINGFPPFDKLLVTHAGIANCRTCKLNLNKQKSTTLKNMNKLESQLHKLIQQEEELVSLKSKINAAVH